MNLIICNPIITVADRLSRSQDRRFYGPVTPSGCRWCGVAERDHMQRRTPCCRTWERPTSAQILARMRARHSARITAPATRYHVATGEETTWSYLSDAPITEEFCADCADPECSRWIRIWERIDYRKALLSLQR